MNIYFHIYHRIRYLIFNSINNYFNILEITCEDELTFFWGGEGYVLVHISNKKAAKQQLNMENHGK